MSGDGDALVDLVDLEDNVVGAAPRARLRESGAHYRVAHVLVFDSMGRLLLQRLADAKAGAPPTWGSSVAGHVEAGETYHAAAVREMREELGIERADLTFVGKTWMDGDDGQRKFISVFTARHDGPFRPDPAEIAELEAVAPDRIERMLRSREREFTRTFEFVFQAARTCLAPTMD